MAIRIFAADDDENIRNLIKVFLESEGYDISIFTNGDDLYKAFENQPADLIVLDIMMPGTDGLTLCHKIRQSSNVPIIMLTAKDTDSDYITGITMGSDDYLTKPFRPTMLVMRIKALLRRISMERQQVKVDMINNRKEDISFGDLVYDHKAHEVLCKGNSLKLTVTEMKLMQYVLKRPKEAISKDELLDHVWGQSAEIETRVTDETVRRIRKKMKLCKSNTLIRTVWGYGYKLDLMED